jgi:hypothetical protein
MACENSDEGHRIAVDSLELEGDALAAIILGDAEGLGVFEHAAGEVSGSRAVFGSAFEPEHGVMRQRHRLSGTGCSSSSPDGGEGACWRPDDPVFVERGSRHGDLLPFSVSMTMELL